MWRRRPLKGSVMAIRVARAAVLRQLTAGAVVARRRRRRPAALVGLSVVVMTVAMGISTSTGADSTSNSDTAPISTSGASTSSTPSSASTASTAQNPGGSDVPSGCNNQDCFWSRISGLVTVGKGLRLERWYVDESGDTSCTDPGGTDLDPYVLSSNSWCLESNANTRIIFYYEIDTWDGSTWRDTGYYIDGYAFVPLSGANVVSCTIKLRHTRQDTGTSSPYTCSVAWADSDPHSTDPQPHWNIGAKPTTEVTDPTQAVDLLNRYCKAGQQNPQCTYKAASQEVMVAPKSAWQLYGQPYANCVDEKGAPYSLEVSRELSWEDSISGKVKAQFDIGVVEATVEAAYSHKIGAKYAIKQVYRTTVPYGKTVGFYIQPGYLQITGDFLLATADNIYSIKGFTMDFPLAEEYSPPQHPELKFEPAIIYTVVIGKAACPSSAAGGGGAGQLTPGSPPPAGAVVSGQAEPVNP